MNVTWTEEQKKVIELHNRNLLVSAAAGSGKTAVLVERIIQMILNRDHPVDIDRLLVVTFTNAAAAEMRERIGAALDQALEKEPDNLHLQRQVTLIHNAQISTIHSFCLQIIRSHFFQIDLDPGFRIGDERENSMLKEDVLDDVLEEAYGKKDEGFLEFISSYGNTKNDDNIKKMVLALYEYANSYPWPKKWLEESLKLYECSTTEEMEKQPWMEDLMDFLRQTAESLIHRESQLYALASEPEGPALYKETLEDDIHILEELKNETTYTGWYKRLEVLKFAALSRKKQECSAEKKEEIKSARDAVKKQITDIKKIYFSYSPEEQLQMLKEEKKAMKALTDLVLRFMECFQKEKADRNVLDFSDIEHFALDILADGETGQPTATAREYQQKFEEIMVDEYQDSNYVQEALLQAVSGTGAGKNNLFMVGDVKQSIYRFRLARPELFMEKYNRYTLEESPEQKIDLHKNFRSRREVLDFTNEVFYHVMDRDIGNVAYDQAAALYPGASYSQGDDPQTYRTELLGIIREDPKEDKVELEARAAAAKIREITQKGIRGSWFPEYRDIVILVHALKGWSETFVRVFSEEGIPLVTTSKSGYFSAPEVQTMIQMLKILDNPRQDIPLTGVLASRIGNFSSEELAFIRTAYPDMPFCECVLRWDTITETELQQLWQEPQEQLQGGRIREKVRGFWNMIRSLRELSQDTPIHLLIQEIYDRTGFLDYITALPGGGQRRANLEMFLERAIAYEDTSYQGLFHFIRYIEQMLKYELDYGEAEMVSDRENAVRLMTIHKSKGLEFPVVFLCGMGKEFNLNTLKQSVIFHPRYGIGMNWMDGSRRIRRNFLVRQVFGLLEKRELLGEEMRLLYVALTRAREKLFLTGIYDIKKGCGGMGLKPGEKMPFVKRMEAKCFWDWVLPAVLDENKPWKLETVSGSDLEELEDKKRRELTQLRGRILDELDKADRETREYQDRLTKVLDWEYPWAAVSRRKQKVSVSELKHRFMEESAREEAEFMYQEPDVVPYLPKFAGSEEEENGGALRGTAMHRFLECLDFGSLPEDPCKIGTWICAELERMKEQRLIGDSLAERLNLKQLEGFAGGELAKRMKEAAFRGELFKERPFVMSLPAREVWEEAEDEDPVLIQGIVDVFWVEDDGITLLDYKTDFVKDPKELIRRYEKQLALYGKALAGVFDGRKIKDIYIYSFHFQQVIRLDLEQA